MCQFVFFCCSAAEFFADFAGFRRGGREVGNQRQKPAETLCQNESQKSRKRGKSRDRSDQRVQFTVNQASRNRCRFRNQAAKSFAYGAEKDKENMGRSRLTRGESRLAPRRVLQTTKEASILTQQETRFF